MGKKKYRKKRMRPPTNNITKWQDPAALVMTAAGEQTYYDWCREEAARQYGLGRAARVMPWQKLVAVVVDPLAWISIQ